MIKTSVVTMTTDAQLLFKPNNASLDDPTPACLLNTNEVGGAVVYIGGSDVSIAQGFPLMSQVAFPIALFANDEIYGLIAGDTSADVAIILGRQ